MPVEQRDPRQTFKAIALGLGAVGAAVGFLLLVLWVTDRGGVEIALGDDVFQAGRVGVLAEEIDENGPIIYADLIGGRQNIIVQHIGNDPETGWFVFDLVRQGSTDNCQLEWVAAIDKFRDECDGTEFPATGFGQPTYPITIDDNNELIVNFRLDDESSDTPEDDS